MRRISAKMVSRILTDGEKQSWLHISSGFLHNAEMCDRVSKGDETWCFQYDPETKRQSMQWKTEFTSAKNGTSVSLAVYFTMNSLHKDKR
jgi:hypothetical protein